MRPTPTHIGRALADRLRRAQAPGTTSAVLGAISPAPGTTSGALGAISAVPVRKGLPAAVRSRSLPRAERLRRLIGVARITPYQLRRGWLW